MNKKPECKKTLYHEGIIFILFLTLNVSLHGQEYVPLIDTTRTWNVAEYGGHGGGSENFEYFFGDTVSIDDTLYVEVKAQWLNKSNLQGYMREDTVSRKVYYRSIYDDESTLLYDFSLEEGDTVQLYGDPGQKYTVLQVDSIELLNGDFRKRWVFSLQFYHTNAVWIEGIGNTTIYLLNPGDLDGSTIETVTLCCYENEELVYMNDTYNTCYLDWVNVSETNIETIKVYPNPARDHITISAEAGAKLKVHMYNIQGRLILKQQIENHETFDISHFDPGLIFVRIIDNENKVASFKTIKL